MLSEFNSAHLKSSENFDDKSRLKNNNDAEEKKNGRCQFYQHFMSGFLVQKFCAKLFCTYIFGLYFFWRKNIDANKMLVMLTTELLTTTKT
jgi:hypothetical protein